MILLIEGKEVHGDICICVVIGGCSSHTSFVSCFIARGLLLFFLKSNRDGFAFVIRKCLVLV